MPTSSEDVDALFGAATPPPAVFNAPAAARNGHAADGRREPRVKVSWPARMQLPNGRVLELRTRDLSASGVGLLTPSHIPANAVVNFAMGVPGLDQPQTITPVSGTVKTTYLVVQGPDIYCGGMWVNLPHASRELLDQWIRKLRR
jgi:hypothetical protein